MQIAMGTSEWGGGGGGVTPVKEGKVMTRQERPIFSSWRDRSK